MKKYFIAFYYSVDDKPKFGNIIDNADFSTHESILKEQEKIRSTLALRFGVVIDTLAIINFKLLK
jgi:hypothetical protein